MLRRMNYAILRVRMKLGTDSAARAARHRELDLQDKLKAAAIRRRLEKQMGDEREVRAEEAGGLVKLTSMVETGRALERGDRVILRSAKTPAPKTGGGSSVTVEEVEAPDDFEAMLHEYHTVSALDTMDAGMPERIRDPRGEPRWRMGDASKNRRAEIGIGSSEDSPNADAIEHFLKYHEFPKA